MDLTMKSTSSDRSSNSNNPSPHRFDEIKQVDGAINNENLGIDSSNSINSLRSSVGHIKLDIEPNENNENESSPVQCTSGSSLTSTHNKQLSIPETPSSSDETITQELINMPDEEFKNLLESVRDPHKPVTSEHATMINQLKHSNSKTTEVPTVTLSNSKYSSSLQSLDEPQSSPASISTTIPNPKCPKSPVNKNGWDQGRDLNCTSDHPEPNSPSTSQYKPSSSIPPNPRVGTSSPISPSTAQFYPEEELGINSHSYTVHIPHCTQTQQFKVIPMSLYETSSNSSNNNNYSDPQYGRGQYPNINVSRISPDPSNPAQAHARPHQSYMVAGGGRGSSYSSSNCNANNPLNLESKETDHQRTSLDGGTRRHLECTTDKFLQNVDMAINKDIDIGSIRALPPGHISLPDDYCSVQSVTGSIPRLFNSSSGSGLRHSPLQSRSETPVPGETASASLSVVRRPGSYEEKRSQRIKKQAMSKEKEIVVPDETRKKTNEMYKNIDDLVRFIGGEEEQTGKKKGNGRKGKRKEILSKSHSLDENALGDEVDQSIGTAHSASSTSVEKKSGDTDKRDQEAEEKRMKEKNPKKPVKKKLDLERKLDEGNHANETEPVNKTDSYEIIPASGEKKGVEQLPEPIQEASNKLKEFDKVQEAATETLAKKKEPVKVQEPVPEVVLQKKVSVEPLEVLPETLVTKRESKGNNPGCQKKDLPKTEQRTQSKEKETSKADPVSQKKEPPKSIQVAILEAPVQKKEKIAEKSQPIRSTPPPPSSHSVHANAQEEKLVNGLSSPKLSSSSEFITVTNRKKNKIQKPVELPKGKPTPPQAYKAEPSGIEKEKVLPDKALLLKQSQREPLNNAKKPQSFDLQTTKKTDFKLGNKSDTYASHVYTNSARKLNHRAGSLGSVDAKSQQTPKPNNPPPTSFDLDSDPPLCPIPKQTPNRNPWRKSYLECARSTVTSSASANPVSSAPKVSSSTAQTSTPAQQAEPSSQTISIEPKDQTKEPVEFCGVNFDNKSDILTKPDVEVEFGFGVSDVLQAGPGAFKLEKSENVKEEGISPSSAPLPETEKVEPKSESETKIVQSEPVFREKSPQISPVQSPESCATPVIERAPAEQSHFMRIPETSQTTHENFVPAVSQPVFYTQVPPYPGNNVPYPYGQVNMMSFYPPPPGQQQQIHIQQTTGPIMSTMPSPSINSTQQLSQHQVQMHPHTQPHAGHPGNTHGMTFHPPPHYQTPYNMNHNMIIPQGQPGQQVLSPGPPYPISITPAKQSPSPHLNSNMNPYIAHYQPQQYQNYNRSPNQPVTPPALIPNMNQTHGQNVQHYMPNPANQNSPQVPVQQSPQGSVHVQHNLPPGTYPVQQVTNIRSQPPLNQPSQQQHQANSHAIDLSSLSALPRGAGRGGRGVGRRGGTGPSHYNNDRGNYRGNNGGGGDMGYRGDSNSHHRPSHNTHNHYSPHSPYTAQQHSKKYEELTRHREVEPEPERQSVPQTVQIPDEKKDTTDDWGESAINISADNPLSKYYKEPETNPKYEQYSKEGQEYMDKYAEALFAKHKKGIIKIHRV